jgi:hypothetical protein
VDIREALRVLVPIIAILCASVFLQSQKRHLAWLEGHYGGYDFRTGKARQNHERQSRVQKEERTTRTRLNRKRRFRRQNTARGEL